MRIELQQNLEDFAKSGPAQGHLFHVPAGRSSRARERLSRTGLPMNVHHAATENVFDIFIPLEYS